MADKILGRALPSLAPPRSATDYRPGECALGGECPGLPSLVDLRLQATEQLQQLQTPREDCIWGTSQLTPGLFGDRDNTSVVNYAILGLRPRTA